MSSVNKFCTCSYTQEPKFVGYATFQAGIEEFESGKIKIVGWSRDLKHFKKISAKHRYLILETSIWWESTLPKVMGKIQKVPDVPKIL